MKKLTWGLVLAIALFCGQAQAAEDATEATAQTAENPNPAAQFTGKYWIETVEKSKLAYLFGIESAISVDYYISKLPKKAGKKAESYPLSPFESGWIKALRGVDRSTIAAEIDKWYMDNPDQLGRPVMDVIWYEIIKPRLDKASNK